MKKSFKKYAWTAGSVHKVSADVAASVTNDLESKGMLTAKNLVDASRPIDAPLHPEFEWDDSIAAEKYRETQARTIINSLRVVVEEKEPERVFCNISRSDPTYMTIEKALSSADTRQTLLNQAFRELESFRYKYRQLQEMASVIEVIDSVLEGEDKDRRNVG